jgi:hypothetical protein
MILTWERVAAHVVQYQWPCGQLQLNIHPNPDLMTTSEEEELQSIIKGHSEY